MARALRSMLWRAVAYAVVLELMLIPAILYFPEFEKHTRQLRAMAPLPVLRDIVDTLEEGGVFAYVTGQHFFKGCNTLGTAAAVLLAAGAVAGEVHRGTFEIWLARPVSRVRLLTERWIQGALAVTLPVVATTLSIPWLLTKVGYALPYSPLLLSAVQQCAMLLAIYSTTFFLSTLARAPMGIAFAMLVFTIFQFAVYLVERMTHWSLFRLTDVERFLDIQRTGGFDWRALGPLVFVTLAMYVASLVSFARRTP
ncbi:MAG: ABC transporter permease subunit [Planctomycetes bacterium]|nr:ABC transporter permease subunit [Planctomycetota bacterium]